MNVWYLSLAGPERFFGAVVLEGDFVNEREAWVAASTLLTEQGVAVPDDLDVLGDEVPANERELYRPHAGRLLSREDLARLFSRMIKIVTTEPDEHGVRDVEIEGEL